MDEKNDNFYLQVSSRKSLSSVQMYPSVFEMACIFKYRKIGNF